MGEGHKYYVSGCVYGILSDAMIYIWSIRPIDQCMTHETQAFFLYRKRYKNGILY